MRRVNQILKSIFDYIVAGISLILLLPIFIIIGILIKIYSKGPIFFKQERLGKNGKVFKIYKFRTMVDNAINLGKGLSIQKNDSRITKIGNFLRKTSLDELPQFINILRGEMSFVGPRPPVPYHPYKYENYTNQKRKRFLMRPGVTGLAQISGRNNLTWDERIEFDIKYIDKFNFFYDMKILLKTIKKVFFKEGIDFNK